MERNLEEGKGDEEAELFKSPRPGERRARGTRCSRIRQLSGSEQVYKGKHEDQDGGEQERGAGGGDSPSLLEQQLL